MSWLEGVLALVQKDLRVELRTRTALSSIVLFTTAAVVLVSWTVGGFSLAPELRASLIWIIVFFAAMAGLSRSFVMEEERGTALALRLTARGDQVFVAKFCINLLLLLTLELLLLGLTSIWLPWPAVNWGLLLLTLGLGGLALAAATTLTAAIVSQAGVRGALFTVLSFPLLVPVLMAGVGATRRALLLEPVARASTELQLLVSYTGVMLTLAMLLFDFVWRD